MKHNSSRENLSQVISSLNLFFTLYDSNRYNTVESDNPKSSVIGKFQYNTKSGGVLTMGRRDLMIRSS